MPNKKNNSKRGRRGRRMKMQAPRQYGLVPNAFRTTMVYPATFVLTETVGSNPAFNTFAINSLYDPDFSSTGAQPVGYDQWSQMYGRFTVVGFEFSFTHASRQGASNSPMQVGWFTHVQSTPTSSFQAWNGQRQSEAALIAGNTAGPCLKTFNGRLLPWEVASITKSQYMDENDYSHLSASGPVRPLYITTYVTGQGQLGISVVQVKLIYHVELREPVMLAIS